LEAKFWEQLAVFKSNVRVCIIKLLLQLEWRSLSDIAEKLEKDYGLKITLPGLLKHMKQLEDAGIIRHESGVFAEKPDARKTVYLLEGKERVEKILQQLENGIGRLLTAGYLFTETAKMARRIQGMGTQMSKNNNERFESLLAKCESQDVNKLLTEDEKKKLKLWRLMINL
jgi:DNA-binding transcriptional ArsR family regulator